MSALAIAGLVVAGLFSLWAISVCVFLLGGAIKRLNAEYDQRTDHASIWSWGVVYAVAALLVLFLLVRFIKFSWEL